MNNQRNAGLSLVELLISMGVLGILLVAIVSLTSSFLTYSGRVSTINDRLSELNDAAGYIATNGRRAMAVVGAGAVAGGSLTSIDITDGTDTFTCSVPSADGPCVGFVVPVVDRSTTASDITGFDLLAYRVIPLSAWADDPGLAEGWNGADTPLMLEYRVSLCTGCSTPPSVPSTATAVQASMVIPDLFLEDAGGNPIAPFDVFLDTAQMTIRLRAAGSGESVDTRVPADGPLELTVVRRP